MHQTEEEIQRLTAKHAERLRKAQAGLPEGPMTVAEAQKWMVKNNLESPELLETILKKQGTGATAGKKGCPECDARMKFQGIRQCTIHTGRTGLVSFGRAYYTCTSKNCSHTETPLDDLLGLSRHMAAGKFEEQISRLSAVQPFELVRAYLEEIDGISITETMIRETAEDCGQLLIKNDEEAASSLQLIPSPPTDTLNVEADGSMVPLRSTDGKTVEYRENKLGIVFRSEDVETSPDGKSQIHKKRFVTSLCRGVEHFEKLPKHRAAECGSRRAGPIVFISDGAEWIDQMRQRLFPKSVHILDWYHAEEHLWSCAKAIFGESASASHTTWVNPKRELLWEGLGEAVCEHLKFQAQRHPGKQTEIHELRSYLESRIKKMRYADFRRQGYFVGSGAVESANKYLVQTRLKQAGMKWTRDGAPAIIKLREILYDGSWRATWAGRAA